MERTAGVVRIMVVGVLTVRLAIYQALSLKDKRRVVKSIKDVVAHRFNVSVAEVGALDVRQQAILAFAMVGNDGRYIESCLSRIVDRVRRVGSASLVDYEVEML